MYKVNYSKRLMSSLFKYDNKIDKILLLKKEFNWRKSLKND